MNSKGTCSNKTIGQVINSLSIIVLLFVYLTGTVEFSSFHSVLHPADEVGLHSESNESNACHQTIYHNVAGKNCEHTSHLAAAKKCPLCHLSFQSQDLFNVSVTDNPNQFIVFFSGVAENTFKSKSFSQDPSRAPPVV